MSQAERARRYRDRKKQRDHSNALHAEAARPADDPEDAAEVLRWVAGALRHDKAKDGAVEPVTEEQAPSEQAWGLFRACRTDPIQARQFWTKYLAFLEASTKPAAESQAKVDDRRRMFKLFDALRRERPDLIERKQAHDQAQAAEDARRANWNRRDAAAAQEPEANPKVTPGLSSHAPELGAPGSPGVEVIGTDGLEVAAAGFVELGPRRPARAA